LKGRTTIATKAKKASSAKPAAAAKPQHKMHALVMKMLDQDKGEDIVSIDLAGKTAIADYMVIVTGKSTRQVIGMAEKLRARLSEEGIKARLEGQDTGDWVIVDAGDVIVHIFRPEVREFYNLEKLWSADFSTVDYTLYQSAQT
jgi:ribosome-associated protein